MHARSFPLRTSNDDKWCASVRDTLDAVADGSRVQLDQTISAVDSSPGSTATTRNQALSYFAPRGCAVPTLTADEARGVLERYGLVALCGDSLVRQMHQGVALRATGRLRDGTTSFGSNCSCDGQFSESITCRDHVRPTTPSEVRLKLLYTS